MTDTRIQKALAMATGMALALSLVACGGAEPETDARDDTKETEIVESTADGDKRETDDEPADADAEDGSDTEIEATSQDIIDEPIENGYETGKHEATIVVKDYGTIKLELDADTAPITVSNFAELANQHFYDGLTFHRIMRNFMIQGGDPLGNGTGGSEQQIKGEFSNNNVKNDLKHTRGTISMARSSDMNSASSQFFICDADSDFLDGDYAAFGHVTEGMDVIDKIAKDANPIDGNGTIPSNEQPVIESIRVGDGSLG